MARIARVVVTGACYVGRSLARRDHERKVKIPEIKYGVPGITQLENDLMEKFYVL